MPTKRYIAVNSTKGRMQNAECRIPPTFKN